MQKMMSRPVITTGMNRQVLGSHGSFSLDAKESLNTFKHLQTTERISSERGDDTFDDSQSSQR